MLESKQLVKIKEGSKSFKTARILKTGGVVIFPTDTVYGIGCRYDDPKAIDRIHQIKKTPKDQPFPILVSKTDQVKSLAIITKVGQNLIDKHWPGALTVIFPFRHPSGASQNDTSKVGFRMPDSKLLLDLINKVGVPIIGTSANFHGRKSPKSFGQLDPKFLKLVDFVIKGECKKGIESTVVDTTFDPPRILRHGAVDIILINYALKIDTTKREEVIVELLDAKSGPKDKLVQTQKLGSQVLLPMITKILKKNKISFTDLTGIEVNPGPGSFTGTRVGVSVANALGFSLNIPVNGKKGKIVLPIYEKSKFD